MNLFVTDRVESSEDGELIPVLTDSEAHHALTVLRLRNGDPVVVTDGKGRFFRGNVDSASTGEVRVRSEQVEIVAQPSPLLTVAVGLIKKRDRLEFAVEKAVELGVREIVVFAADHSEKRGVRLDRLESAALAAMKQSMRAWRPIIRWCDNLDELFGTDEFFESLWVADEQLSQDGLNPQELDREQFGSDKCMVFIGPEGGFSDRERTLLSERSVQPFSLGRYRLRTETAVVVTAARLNIR